MIKRRLKFAIVFILIAGIVPVSGIISACGSRSAKPLTAQTYMLGTIVEISIYDYDGDSREVLEDCIELCGKYEKIFSRTLEGSELYNLNIEMAKDGEAEISDELRTIIESSLYYSRLSEGSFDITIGSVTELWDFVSGSGHIPEKSELERAIKLVSYENIRIEEDIITAPPGTVFDLGAIAKGYIADRLKEYLLEKGVDGAIINLGGNVLCIGGLTERKPFTIGVKKPFGKEGEISLYLKIKNLSAVTSGPYERYFIRDDRLYHHILDTRTGYPVETDLFSVTVISGSSELCDAMSTACFALGLEKAKKLIEDMNDVYAVFIDREGRIVLTDGISEAMKVIEA